MTTYKSIVTTTLPAIYMVERRLPGHTIAEDILGTAFLVDATRGLLATAAHVVRQSEHEVVWVRSMYGPAGHYGMTPASIRQIHFDANKDIAILEISSFSTKRRSVALGQCPEIGDVILLFGFAHGTALTYCDEILGTSSPKSPTPLAFNAMVSTHVPADGRKPELIVYDTTTFGGNSGGPLVSTETGEIVGMHIRSAANAVGYGIPIEDILAVASTVVQSARPSTTTAISAQIQSFISACEGASEELSAHGLPNIDIQATLMDALELERAEDLLSHEWTPAAIVAIVQDYDRRVPRSTVLGTIYLEATILPVGIPKKLEEARIKACGEVWEIHKHDADPFPSNPHAHNLETGYKLCLSTGKLYKKTKEVDSISKKDLLNVRTLAQQKGFDLPALV